MIKIAMATRIKAAPSKQANNQKLALKMITTKREELVIMAHEMCCMRRRTTTFIKRNTANCKRIQLLYPDIVSYYYRYTNYDFTKIDFSTCLDFYSFQL